MAYPYKVQVVLPQNLSAILSDTCVQWFPPKNTGIFSLLWKLGIHSLADTVACNLRQPETSTVQIIEYCSLGFSWIVTNYPLHKEINLAE